jgi:hypothetical protein
MRVSGRGLYPSSIVGAYNSVLEKLPILVSSELVQ